MNIAVIVGLHIDYGAIHDNEVPLQIFGDCNRTIDLVHINTSFLLFSIAEKVERDNEECMKVKITIKGKAGQAGTLAEALDGFLKDELKVRAKYSEKTQYEIHVVQRTFYRTVKGSRAAKDAEQAEGKG